MPSDLISTVNRPCFDRCRVAGNRLLNVVTSGQPQEMRMKVTDVNGSQHHATYSNFTVDGPQNFYRLKLGGFLTGQRRQPTMHLFIYLLNFIKRMHDYKIGHMIKQWNWYGAADLVQTVA